MALTLIKRGLRLTVAALGFAACLISFSAQGAQVVIGQVAPLSGPEGDQGRAYAAGMRLYFDSVNRFGGISGQTFALVSQDNGGRSDETVSLTRQLLAQSQPIILAGYVGSGDVSKLRNADLLSKEKIALMGYHAIDVQGEVPLLYNVRASLLDELRKIIGNITATGATRLGLLYQEGPDAAAVVKSLEEAAKQRNATVVVTASYPAGSARISSAIDTLVQSKAQAIILVCSGAVGARFVELYRAAAGSAQIYVHSGADLERVAQEIAADRLAFVSTVMRGVAIAQVVPNPNGASRLAKELQEAFLKFGKRDSYVSYTTMEGYIAAKVIVEAVRRQGKHPTREGMTTTFDGIADLDIGGYGIGFRPAMRTGSNFVELVIISDTGKIRR